VDVSQLQKIPLFAEVPEEALKKIAPFATSEQWPEGKEIVSEGGYSNHFYAIESGSAKVVRGGEEVGQLGEGDVFGEQGLLEKSERTASVISTSDISLIKIEHWELSRMKKSMPEAVEQLEQKIAERTGG
jgi:CRP-like cAMP-binding protein